MKQNVILTIDQSTSGTKAMFVNENGEIVQKVHKDHHQIYPREGWIEHDPLEIYENIKTLLSDLSSSESQFNVQALSITNQRETIVVWDKYTGKPVYNAIVWQCRRTEKICKDMTDKGYNTFVHDKTGLKLDPFIFAEKMIWIFENVECVKQKVYDGDMLIGTMDSWIIWKLTDGRKHVTDYTNDSRTLLFNIYTLDWDKDLLDIFDVPHNALTMLLNSDDIFGSIEDPECPFHLIPISGVIGDSQGALFGQQCYDLGMSKATFGTGTSVLVYTKDPVQSHTGFVTSLAWSVAGKVHYAIEGVINSTGDTLKWLVEDLQLINDVSEAEPLAKTLIDNGGVYLVPAFIGLGTPYWRPDARAAMMGIQRNTEKAHIVRAALESMAYQVKDIIDLIEDETHIRIKELRVDGGGSNNEFLMQFQSNILNKQLTVSKTAELSALGSAYLAGLGIGMWESLDRIKSLHRKAKVFKPNMTELKAHQNYQGWKWAVQRLE